MEKNVLLKLELLREELKVKVNQLGLGHSQVLRLSQEIDRLHNTLNRQQCATKNKEHNISRYNRNSNRSNHIYEEELFYA